MKFKGKIVIIFTIILLMCVNIVYAVNLSLNIPTVEVNIDDVLEFSIDFDEDIVTADFSIYYDNEKLNYIGSSTENLKTNYISDSKEMICCYYDLEKNGTNKISLKFKALEETNGTNIKISNILVHTTAKEEKIEDIVSENIKIVKKDSSSKTDNTQDVITKPTNSTTTDTTQDIITKPTNGTTNSTTSSETTKKDDTTIDNTISIKPLPGTGRNKMIKNIVMSLIILTGICSWLLINIYQMREITLSIFGIAILGSLLLSNHVFATNNDQIFINKTDKTILIVLSKSNEKRNMSVNDFKEKTNAVSVSSEVLDKGAIATFKNNEKYQVEIYGDEDGNGYVNSSDIFELLNKNDNSAENIEEICNFIIKKDELKNYNLDGYEEFTEDSIVTPSTTPLIPATDRYTAIKNVEELKALDAKVGDKYKTLGYYSEDDEGAGRYDIIEKSEDMQIDNGRYIELDNGLVAELSVRNDTVNVKQFGAFGDGKNDDVQFLRNAFNSGIQNVEMIKGEYKITDCIALDTPNTNIIGNDSIIFTDNDFDPEKWSEFLIMMKSNDCSINKLNIEARETINSEKLYKSQLYVWATNIKITECTFKVPETASSERGYGNIDLYSGWHNVLIDNCELYVLNDATEGGCIWIRDLFDKGASDVTFSNNKCYKKTHDEILAVFMGTIENVNILNNTFIMEESTDPTVMAFSIRQVKNCKFEGNTIEANGTMSFCDVKVGAKNVSIKNNHVKFDYTSSDSNKFFIYCPADSAVEDLKIEDNEFEINNEDENLITGILSTSSSETTFKNNTVVVNGSVKEAFTGDIYNNNNNMTFNGAVTILTNKPREFNNNNIIFNEGFGSLVQYHSGEIGYDSNVINNTFENNFDEKTANNKSILVMLNGGTLNGCVVNFEGNTIKSEKGNFGIDLIYLLAIKDTEPQTIKFINNKFGGYKNGWKEKNTNQEMHSIIMEGNE